MQPHAAVVSEKDVEKIDSVIVGAGPAGLLSVNMLTRKFPYVSNIFYASEVEQNQDAAS